MMKSLELSLVSGSLRSWLGGQRQERFFIWFYSSNVTHLLCKFQLTRGVSCWLGEWSSGSVCEGGLVYQSSGDNEKGDVSFLII